MKYSLWFVVLFSTQFIAAQDTVSVLIDFGTTLSPAPWNNLEGARTGRLDQLFDVEGFPLDFKIVVDDAFNGINNSGTTSPDPSLNLPATASGDSFFGNRDSFSNALEPTGGVLITGLDIDKQYNIDLFASRLANDNRETQYNISSASNDTFFLQVSNNTSNWLSINQLTPRQDGSLHIQATTGPNNDNSFGFFYLGALKLQYIDTMRSMTRQLNLIAPTSGAYWQPGKKPEIRWKSLGNPMIRVEYSINNGNTWNFIDSISGMEEKYEWTIPNRPSENCIVRLTSDSLISQNQQPFTIADEDSSQCHIVVLGSSTAAGTGPSIRDSAWVWKYRDYLFQKDTRFKVSNLAKGGFTTYNILPTGTPIPTGIDQTIDTARNITKALSLAPDVLIINLPSNDAARNYPVSDQLRNYDQILSLTVSDSIPVWVCTPQPRNFGAQEINIQLELLDSTFSRFGSFAIDFWATIADNANRINPQFDSGDGVHLNDEGHQILLERILGAKIDSFLLQKKNPDMTTNIYSPSTNPLQFRIYPNPGQDIFTLSYNLPQSDFLSIELIDISGKVVKRLRLPVQASGKHQLELPVNELIDGVYFCKAVLGETSIQQVIRFVIEKDGQR